MKKLVLYIYVITFLISCSNSKDEYYHNDSIPKHESIQIHSNVLGEDRTINIWKPSNYNQVQDSFPVLYMPDGGIKEDFPHIANTLDTLIQKGKVPSFILVGIENTERWRDMTPESTFERDKETGIPMTDGAKNFRSFILNELIPKINSTYKTKPKRGIIGESLAGLFVIETALKSPESFDVYICMDPSIWWNDESLTKKADSLLAQFSIKPIKLWCAASGAEGASELIGRLDSVVQGAKPASLSWSYRAKPKEKHSTIYRATKESALIWGLND